jgi:hypothetical protein
MEGWVDHDVMPEEETPGDIFLNDILPILVAYEEMSGSKATPARNKTIKEQQEE